MYAFVSHDSACDVLRTLGNRVASMPRWPAEARELPRHYNSVTNQRMFKQYAQTVDLAAYGLSKTPIDLLVPKASQRSRGKLARFHAWKGPVPPSSLLRLEKTLFVSSPEFVLVQMAGWHHRRAKVADAFVEEHQSRREAYAQFGIDADVPYDDPFIWAHRERDLRMVLVVCEFMGTYRLGTQASPTNYQVAPILTRNHVDAFMDSVSYLYGRERLKRTLDLAFNHSASPMETALALMLSLPEAYGGYGLPKPKLNRELPVGHHELLWSGGPRITPDLLWPDNKLVIEYDSNERHGSAGPHKLADDATRTNVLTTLGYSVLRVTTLNIQSPSDTERLARQVSEKLGVPFPEEDEVMHIRRAKLRALLLRQ